MNADESSFAQCRAVEIAATGADHLMILFEAYFDEGGTHAGAAVHCVAGYLIESTAAIEMTKAWQAVLDQHKLPFFHMVDCAHGNGHFKAIDRDVRSNIARRLIELIKIYAIRGFAAVGNPIFVVNKTDRFPDNDFYPFSVFAMSAQARIEAAFFPFRITGIDPVRFELAKDYIDNADDFKTQIYMIFEAGHKSQSRGAAVLNAVSNIDTSGLGPPPPSPIGGISFLNKSQAPLMQAADILAWQCGSFVRGLIESRPMRKDFRSLLEIPHNIMYFYVPDFDNLPDEKKRMVHSTDFAPHDDNETKRAEILEIILNNIIPKSAEQFFKK